MPQEQALASGLTVRRRHPSRSVSLRRPIDRLSATFSLGSRPIVAYDSRYCMKLTATTTTALLFLSTIALRAEWPAWVKGTVESITLKQAGETPGYLSIQQTVTLIRPQPLTQLSDLEKLNPGLSKVLPRLAKLFPTATVSPKFAALYAAKVEAVKGGYLMPAHSYFDTPTAVTFTAPETGRKVFLFQSDMDVDTDGSDPVRMSKLKDYDDARVSRSYQPLLAYSWAKADSETAESPFIQY